MLVRDVYHWIFDHSGPRLRRPLNMFPGLWRSLEFTARQVVSQGTERGSTREKPLRAAGQQPWPAPQFPSGGGRSADKRPVCARVRVMGFYNGVRFLAQL